MKEFEITVKVENTKDEIKEILKEYKYLRNTRLLDTYMVDKSVNLKGLTPLQILDHCILIRIIGDRICVNKKVKKYDENGDTIFRDVYYLEAKSYEEARGFLENIGYEELMVVDDDMYVYEKDGEEMAIQYVKDAGTLIEIEYEDFSDVESLKKYTVDKLKKLNFKFDETKLDVKKAEIVLKKRLGI